MLNVNISIKISIIQYFTDKEITYRLIKMSLLFLSKGLFFHDTYQKKYLINSETVNI